MLLLGRARWLPVVRGEDDRIEPRLMLPLSLSYDHRLVDGADGRPVPQRSDRLSPVARQAAAAEQ